MSIRNIRLNLLPPEFRPAPTVTIFPIFFGLVVGLAVLFVIVTLLLTQSQIHSLTVKIDVTKQEIASLAPSVKEYDRISGEIAKVEKKKAMFNYLQNGFVDWPEFIRGISPLVPDDVWLYELRSETDKEKKNAGKITILGRTNSESILPVSHFMANIEATPMFRDVKYSSSQLSFINDLPVQDFQISVQVESRRDYIPPEPQKEESEPAKGGSANKPAGNDAAAKPGAT
ncbi:MAG: PilN domain-containing protein [bacterium]|jgi:Tfp pilus assembly protein PilN